MANVIAKLSVKLTAMTRGFMTGMEKAEAKLRSTRESLNSLTVASTKSAAAFGGVAVGITVVAAKFEKSMTRAAAIAGGTQKNFVGSFQAMSEEALRLAGNTKYTANEVAEGMTFMAMAGNNAEGVIASMGAVLQLATAANIGLGEAADTVTNIMAGFGLTTAKVTEEMTRATGQVPEMSTVIKELRAELGRTNNVLVGTFTGSNVTLLELGQTMKNAGPVAKSLGVSLEDLAAAAGILGNAGIKGAEAGTGLKRSIVAMLKGTPKTAKSMKKLGLTMDDLSKPREITFTKKGADPIKLKSAFIPIVKQLEKAKKAFKDAGKESQFTAHLFKVFGDRAGPKMSAMVEQGSDALAKLLLRGDMAKKMDMAEFLELKQLETMSGAWDIFKSSIEGVAIAFGKTLMPLVKVIVRKLSALAKWIKNIHPATKKAISGFVVWAALGSIVVTVLSSLAAALITVALGVKVFAVAMGVLDKKLMLMVVKWAAGIILATAAILFVIGLISDVFIDEMSEVEKAQGKTTSWMIDDWKDVVILIGTVWFTLVRLIFQAFDTVAVGLLSLFASISGIFTMMLDLLTKGFMKLAEIIIHHLLDGVVSLIKTLQKFPKFASLFGLDGGDLDSTIKAVEKLQDKLTNLEGTDLTAGLAKLRQEQEDLVYGGGLAASFLPDAAEKAAVLANIIEDSIETSGRGLGKLFTKVIGDGGDGIKKKIMEALAAGDIDIDALDRLIDTTDKKIKGKAGLSGVTNSLKELDDIINQEVADRKMLSSTNQALDGIMSEYADKQKKVADIVLKSGEDMAEASLMAAFANEEIRRTTVRKLVSEMQGIKSTDELSRAFNWLKENADQLGIDIKKVAKEVGEIPWEDITATAGVSLSDALSKGLGELFRGGGGIKDEDLKAAIKPIASFLSGGGGSLAETVGTAIGGLFGQPQIFAAVVSGVGSMFDTIRNTVENIFTSAGKLIPEGRLGGAVGGAGAIFGPLAVAAAALVGVISVIIGALMPFIAMAVLLTFATGGLFAAFIALNVLVYAIVAVFEVLKAWIGGVIVAAFVGLFGPLIYLTAAFLGLLGVLAVIIGLIPQSETFEKFKKALEGSVDILLKSFEPLGQILMPLAGLFHMVMKVFGVFIDAFVQSLVNARYSIFGFAKELAIGAAMFALTMAQVANVMITLLQWLQPGFTWLMRTVEDLGDVFANVTQYMLEMIKWVMNKVDPMGVTGIGAMASDMITGMEQFQRVTSSMISALDEFVAGMTHIDEDAIRQVIDELRDTTMGAMDDLGNSLANASEEISESLVNVPSGFKVALERFRAIATGGSSITNVGDANENARGMYVAELVINMETDDSDGVLDKIVSEIAKRNGELTGNPNAKQFNPGFG